MSAKTDRRDKLIAAIRKQYERGEISQAQAQLLVDESYDDARRRRNRIG